MKTFNLKKLLNRESYLIILALLSISLMAGCSKEETSATESTSAQASSSEGQTIYENKCASCHGPNLRGTNKGPSLLSIIYEPSHHPDEAIRSAVRNGAVQHHWPYGNMPPVENITDEEIDQVIKFIRSEQESKGFEKA